MCCSVLQCALQCVAVSVRRMMGAGCSVLQCALQCALQCVAVSVRRIMGAGCSVLQCVAVYVAVCCSECEAYNGRRV